MSMDCLWCGQETTNLYHAWLVPKQHIPACDAYCYLAASGQEVSEQDAEAATKLLDAERDYACQDGAGCWVDEQAVKASEIE